MSEENSHEYIVRLNLDADYMHSESNLKVAHPKEWSKFVDNLLQNVCAARNTPCLLPKSYSQRLWWQIIIHLDNAGQHDDDEFSDRFDDKLFSLLTHKENLCDVYMMNQQDNALRIHIQSSSEEVSTKDYKTTQSTNKGLRDSSTLGMGYICHCIYRTPSMDESIPARPAELCTLQNGQTLTLSEDARLQFKQLKEGDVKNQKNKHGQEERFNPTCGQAYVKWIWSNCKRNLPEYISAFTKNRQGGIIYYGIKEIGGHKGFEVEGLFLDESWKEEIRSGICHQIHHDMLWIQRDLNSENGYKELKPEHQDQSQKGAASNEGQSRKTAVDGNQRQRGHFAVDFIPVQDPSPSQPNPCQPNSPLPSPSQPNSPQPRSQLPSSHQSRTQSSSYQQIYHQSSSHQPRSPQPRFHLSRSHQSRSHQPSSSQAKYVLEVRVAPFNGVVFYDPQGPEAYRMEKKGDPQGPEAYRMEKKGGEFEPVRMSKEEWLKKMRDYGWCSKHRCTKEKECKRCLSEQERNQEIQREAHV